MSGRIYEYARNGLRYAKRPLMHWKNSLFDRKEKLLILVYHRILSDIDRDPLHIVTGSETFLRQVRALARRFEIIPLSEAFKPSETVNVKSDERVVLTFDDGYWDSYEIVFPILKKMGLPAAFFLTTDYVNGKAEFSDRRMLDKKTGMPHNYIKDRFLTWENAKEMGGAGMEIGSHGVTHNSLAQMPQAQAEDEIAKSKKMIELNTGKPCRYFAFPFGSGSDYNKHLIDYVRYAGFDACLLNIHGYNHIQDDRYCFKRIIMEEATDVAHILG